METKNLRPYKEFLNANEAKDFVSLLSKNNIFYALFANGIQVDESIVDEGRMIPILVAINPEQRLALKKIIEVDLNKLKYENLENNVLYEASMDELIELILNAEEHPIEDVIIAKKILMGRDEEINEAEIDRLVADKKRLIVNDFENGKSAKSIWVVIGIASMISAIGRIFFGSKIALLIGMIGLGSAILALPYYIFNKRVDPEGKSHFTYNKTTRIIAAISFLAALYYAFMVIRH